MWKPSVCEKCGVRGTHFVQFTTAWREVSDEGVVGGSDMDDDWTTMWHCSGEECDGEGEATWEDPPTDEELSEGESAA